MKNCVDYYEEIITDHRDLDSKLSEFKRLIRLQPDTIQCETVSEIISESPLNDVWKAWRPNDLTVASRKIVRDTLQKRLFQLHKKILITLPVPLCYRPSV